MTCCGGDGEFIEIANTELATIDRLREKEEKEEVSRSLLNMSRDEAPNDHREMSRSGLRNNF